MASALDRAIKVVGGTGALARAVGISSPAVSQWVRVPPERVIAVERATRRQVTRYELRPDIYPPDEAADPKRAGAAA